MQNVQNVAEIQQRVIYLVELYRSKVGKDSNKAKELSDIYKENYNKEIGYAMEAPDGIHFINTDIPEEHTNCMRANRQLLGYFYSVVAGLEAERAVLDEFLAEYYNHSIFTEEEECFLKSHFKEMVNYINQNPSDDLACIGEFDRMKELSIPAEVLDLIATRISLPSGSTVYYPFANLAQFSAIFEDCIFMCEDTAELHLSEKKKLLWAWAKITLFANNKLGDVIREDVSKSHKYDAIVSFINYVPDDAESDIKSEWRIMCIIEAFNCLRDGGKLVLLCPSSLCRKKWFNPMINEPFSPSQATFRKLLCHESTLVEIIQLPNVINSYATNSFSVIIAEKGRKHGFARLIDARFAFEHPSDMLTPFDMVFDSKAFEAMLNNKGKEVKTGLRKTITLPYSSLDEDRILPQIYVIEKPSKEEHPIRLSSICNRVYKKVRQVKDNLPMDTPWIKETDLSSVFRGALDISLLEKANCPNIPPHTDEYAFDESGSFIEDSIAYLLGNGTIKGYRVAEYRSCTYLDGNSDAVVMCLHHDGIKTAMYRASGKPVVVEGQSFSNNRELIVLHPNKDVDVMHLLAILNLPIVHRQMYAYGSLGYVNLDDILVPSDIRIVGDEIMRMKREESAIKDLSDKAQTMKTEYINEVRMRKHDMRPHLRQIASSERLMRYYIEAVNDMEELKINLRNQLEHSHVALTSISAIVDHLSDEEQFGTPELLNIDEILTDIEVNHDDSEGFVIEYDCDNDSFRNYDNKIASITEQWEIAREQGLDIVNFIKEKVKNKLPMLIYIATVDFQRLATNIMENARKHGFTDKARDDYYIGIELSYNSERGMYQIDFTNNGNPLPDGMTKSRFGIRGEKAGLTAGTGSGGYIVKSIVNHYGGDYDIFCKDGITTVRILLPIATI